MLPNGCAFLIGKALRRGENSMAPIYLDYNATTPLDPAVIEAMLPYLRQHFGNPSSTHEYGRTAHDAVDKARAQVAELIGAQPDEIVFTGGGTEASNHALKGTVFAKPRDGRPWACDAHIITSAVEHPATLQTCDFLKRLGCMITVLPVDHYGLVNPEDVRKAIDQKTVIVTIMHANNEVGTIEPIKEIAAIAHEHGALMHTDAAQSLGKIPVDVNELGVDLLSVAGHKLYAPKGVGALYIRQGVKLEPLIHGAGHESGRRAGTENVPYIVALGEACRIARESLPQASERLRALRDRLWNHLQAGLGDRIVLNGHPDQRLPNTLNVNFLNHSGADLLDHVPLIAASTGSACHEGHVTLSPVLEAMGVSPEVGRGAVRLSVGRFTTEDEIDRAAQALIRQAQRVSVGQRLKSWLGG
jgi:cysteine desulfurase